MRGSFTWQTVFGVKRIQKFAKKSKNCFGGVISSDWKLWKASELGRVEVLQVKVINPHFHKYTCSCSSMKKCWVILLDI